MYLNRIDRAADCMEAVLRKEIDGGGLPGASFAVLYHGSTVIERYINYSPKDIFRIYSMSKPITSVAAHILWERGMLDWNTPLSYYLPEFGHMKVLTEQGLTEAKRPVYLIDLLRMTSGLVYPDSDPAGMEMQKLFDWLQNEIKEGRQVPTRDLCRMIAERPLAFNPGEKWRYGLSCDIMGAVIEEVSGRRLSDFCKEEIFLPLGMYDTGFYVPKEKQSRFTTLYEVDEPDDDKDTSADEPLPQDGDQRTKEKILRYREATTRHLGLTECKSAPAFESGGAGIVSTLDDYVRFADMLVHYGKGNGTRILGRKTAECFEHGQLNEQQRSTIYFDQLPGFTYGNFMRVYDDRTIAACSGDVGEFGWDGWTGPYFLANPKEEFAFVMMLQVGGYHNPQLVRRLRNAAYSIVE